MNLLHDQIAELCAALKLERLAADWHGIAQRAAAEDAGYAEFLKDVLSVELDARTERQRQTLFKLATLPAIKTFEQFDFHFASGAPRSQLQDLAALTFIERAENVVLLGPSGVGKTHLACALA